MIEYLYLFLSILKYINCNHNRNFQNLSNNEIEVVNTECNKNKLKKIFVQPLRIVTIVQDLV